MQRTLLANAILKKNKFEGVGILNYKTYNKSMFIKRVEYLGKDRHMDPQTELSLQE